MPYPESLLHGISQNSSIFKENGIRLVSSGTFDFFPSASHPGRAELSINWEDDSGALGNLQSQIKNDRPQFVGCARLARASVDDIVKRPWANQNFGYERDKKPTNPYHGNIYLNTPNKRIQRLIQGALAMAVVEVI